MIITIIGSYSKKNKMLEVEKLFESIDNTVNCPCDEDRSELPLYMKQASWIEKIIEADLIVAIPKDIRLDDENKETRYILDIGESTSYELAIASYFGKKIVFY